MNEASVGHQCPECVSLGRKTQRPVRTMFGASRAGVHGYATISLIVVNAIMLVASVASAKQAGRALIGGGLGGALGQGTPLTDKLGVIGELTYGNQVGSRFIPLIHYAYGITDGEYYRLFTAMFMHYGLIHLAVNMWALWVLGRPLEAMFGPIRFLGIYLVCGLGGNVAVYLGSPDTNAAGASTAIFGLFGVTFFVLRKLNRSVAPLIPILVINLVISFVPGISLWGHLGGLVTGAVLGYGITHVPQQRRNLLQGAIFAGVLVALAALTAWQVNHLGSLPDYHPG
jgi:membrane associated rhomboid family serine protease